MGNNGTVAKQNGMTLAVYTQEQIELIKRTVAVGATDDELKMFIHVAQTYNLDPFIREIWFMKYDTKAGKKVVIMTSRDGYLAIAHRSGQLDGLNSDTIKDAQGGVIGAWAECWRKDMTHSFRTTVNMTEYKQNTQPWEKYSSAMIIKCAEAFVLKRAFSISGLVTKEEIGENAEALKELPPPTKSAVQQPAPSVNAGAEPPELQYDPEAREYVPTEAAPEDVPLKDSTEPITDSGEWEPPPQLTTRDEAALADEQKRIDAEYAALTEEQIRKSGFISTKTAENYYRKVMKRYGVEEGLFREKFNIKSIYALPWKKKGEADAWLKQFEPKKEETK